MIYKIQSDEPNESSVLEFTQLKENRVGISIYSYKDKDAGAIVINKDQLYDFIGSLITIQQKLKGGKDGRG